MTTLLLQQVLHSFWFIMFDCVLKHAVDISADFSARQYESEEGRQLSIYLSVTYLTSYIPDFTGSIEVEIIAEDLNAAFGKHNVLFIVHLHIYTSYIRTYIHYTHHTYKTVTTCSVYTIVAVITMYWHLHQHSPLCKWSWCSTVCTCILNLCIMLVFVYFLHTETFVCMQASTSITYTCMTKIQCTILHKLLCIVYIC